jgi:hypothetical protein
VTPLAAFAAALIAALVGFGGTVALLVQVVQGTAMAQDTLALRFGGQRTSGRQHRCNALSIILSPSLPTVASSLP